MVGDCPGITAETYHDFCAEVLEKSDMKTNQTSNSAEYWNSELPLLLVRSLEKNPVKFDAVIVDEGQDFHPAYWKGIEMLVKDSGVFYVFYDPDQNLFKTALQLPEYGPEFVLSVNCRNTKRIFERMKQNINTDMSIREDAPEGAEVSAFSIKDPTERKAKLAAILEELVLKKGIDESKIVIIGGHVLRHTCIGKNGSAGKFQIVENGTGSKGRIPYFTYMKFKGCESDVVILLDTDSSDPRWNANGLYCATSRAKHILYEISKN
jgi:DNA helicase IV